MVKSRAINVSWLILGHEDFVGPVITFGRGFEVSFKDYNCVGNSLKYKGTREIISRVPFLIGMLVIPQYNSQMGDLKSAAGSARVMRLGFEELK